MLLSFETFQQPQPTVANRERVRRATGSESADRQDEARAATDLKMATRESPAKLLSENPRTVPDNFGRTPSASFFDGKKSPGVASPAGLGADHEEAEVRAALARLPLFGVGCRRKWLEIMSAVEKVCTTATHSASLPAAVIRGGGCSGRLSLR